MQYSWTKYYWQQVSNDSHNFIIIHFLFKPRQIKTLTGFCSIFRQESDIVSKSNNKTLIKFLATK